jgi:ABC-type transport system involved in cytochrome c biogenesis ATPase subunit
MQTTAPALLLPSLHVQSFRAFRDLQIPHLGRVNLVVGKNNVGKTSLLEALKVYASGMAAPWEIRSLLQGRQEINRTDTIEPTVLDLSRLFFGPSSSPDMSTGIGIGPLASHERLLRIWLAHGKSKQPLSNQSINDYEEDPDDFLALAVVSGGQEPRFYKAFDFLLNSIAPPLIFPGNKFNYQYLPSTSVRVSDIGKLWDRIVLNDQEQDVLEALRIISPDTERLSLIASPAGTDAGRIALVRRKNSRQPEKLRSLGDGMNRIFELALGLVSASGGLFLADEVENGVHYSAQEQLWRFIFEASSRLNVQVFATTHSWDCIEAFQSAASAHKEDGVLISLSRQEDEVKATVFNERDLEIITRESIEVR